MNAIAPNSAATLSDADRLKSFAAALDELKARTEAKIGAADLTYIRRLDATSRGLEAVGRVLIHLSPGPITWTVGVLALWLHKQLQATEVGHTVLHGAFDKIDGAGRFNSKSWRWDAPIDEEAWHEGHNLRHHQFTNIAGKDPDIHFGPVRLTEHTPHGPRHYIQLPFSLIALFPNFGMTMNAHFSGLTDLYQGNGRADEFDFVKDRSWDSIRKAHWRAWRKYLPYYGKEMVFFPLLAGVFWWKVALGNWASEVLRDLYTAATIYCGHVGEDVKTFPEGTRAHGKGEWYAMQAEASQNYEVPLPLSVLSGALDRQIEHHLFPRFPTNRLREIGPEVRAICEAHGVAYTTGSWPSVLGKVLRRIGTLSFRTPAEVAAAQATAGAHV